MPVADFPGRRNWGYDGVDLFAPARCYGRPDDLRRLVDEAHRLGLAVLLDVVYNHLGPEGNYLASFSANYFSAVHRTPWGPAINLDGPRSANVRAFFLENAICWLGNTISTVCGWTPRTACSTTAPIISSPSWPRWSAHRSLDRTIHLIAEDARNLATMVRPVTDGGWGLDGIWSDDFHHELRRYLVGDFEGAFRDFRGSLADLVVTINRGWLFCGEYSIHRGCCRGTDPAGLSPRSFVSSSFRIMIGLAIGLWASGLITRSNRPSTALRRPCSWPRRPHLCCSWGRNGPRVRRSSSSPTIPRSWAGWCRRAGCTSSGITRRSSTRPGDRRYRTVRTNELTSLARSTGRNGSANRTRRRCDSTRLS